MPGPDTLTILRAIDGAVDAGQMVRVSPTSWYWQDELEKGPDDFDPYPDASPEYELRLSDQARVARGEIVRGRKRFDRYANEGW